MRLALGARALVAAAILSLLVAGIAQAVPPKKTPKLSITLTASAVDPTSGQYTLTVTGRRIWHPSSGLAQRTSRVHLRLQSRLDLQHGQFLEIHRHAPGSAAFRDRQSPVGAATARSKRSTTTTGSSRTRSKPQPAEHFGAREVHYKP